MFEKDVSLVDKSARTTRIVFASASLMTHSSRINDGKKTESVSAKAVTSSAHQIRWQRAEASISGKATDTLSMQAPSKSHIQANTS